MKGGVRGEVLSADRTISVFSCGVEETGEAEGMAAGNGYWSSEGVHADWATYFIDL